MKRLNRRSRPQPLLGLALLCSAAPALGQEAEAEAETRAAPAAAAATPESPPAQGARTYTAQDFARFAPRNAYDMLSNVPGFAIEESDTERRGLGQATGNVLINGERWVGKSTDILSELRRISAANVERIEVVDAATLNISGLSGRVANIVTRSQGLSGNFVWRPQIRAQRTPPRLLDGEVSLNGTLGRTQYTLSFRNESYRNGNAGPEIVFTPAGEILDRRDEVLFVNQDIPRLAGSIRHAFADGSVLNANAALGFFINRLGEDSLRSGPNQPDRVRILRERENEYNYELGGDYEFGLVGGRLKLIGLRRFERSPYRQTLTQSFADGRPTQGDRFTQTADETETIARGEYRWRGGRNDWQVSVEGAVNQLDVQNGLFTLDAAGDFVPVPFPNSAATVRERRAETILTYGRPLSPNLTLQAAAGGEYSNLVQEGAGGLDRTFYRPKGFLNLAWQPRPGVDISARIERAVGQLNFFDFVASANVSSGATNAGNANLVPPQSWDAQIQATQNLGAWGTATARFYGRLISDVVDIIPIEGGGQSPGNLEGTARLYGLQWTSTFNFDPIGWRGAKLDMNLQFQRHSLRDPLTFRRRPINENMTRQIEINLRHDIPGSDWAYGGSFFQYRQAPLFRLDERWKFLDTPGNLGVFVEHKDVLGLTVRAGVDNLLDTNESFRRDFFDGRRPAPIRATEDRDRFYGPIFTLTISGTI
ncbi:MAG TPA: TonB-dependent receptor plug domain-containing protein [Allosphingosinicella sp.]|nr:TonB-dependent receptor plug domain-containing protein [Allosphingosinicella sp.]